MIMEEIYKIYDKWKAQDKKEKKLMRKRYDSLTLVERNAYQQIIERNNHTYFSLITTPAWVIFYAGIFSLVMFFAFEINIKEPMLLIIQSMILLWPIFILSFLLLSLIKELNLKKLRKKLLLNGGN